MMKKYAGKLAAGTALARASASASAVDLTGLTLDTSGIDAQAVTIGVSILAVVGAIWGIKKVLGIIGR